MYSLEKELDRLVRRVATRQQPRPGRRPRLIGHDACGCGTGCGGGCGCGCVSCGGNETARRRPRSQGAPNQTPPRAVGTQLPAWRGWTRAAPLDQILDARAKARRGEPVVPRLRPFVLPGPQVYRITRQGIDRARALNIGLTAGRASIADRMLQHRQQPSKGDALVHRRIRDVPPERIMVQAAMLDPAAMRDGRRGRPREVKLYENWLQVRERPLLYRPDTTTFESASDFALSIEGRRP